MQPAVYQRLQQGLPDWPCHGGCGCSWLTAAAAPIALAPPLVTGVETLRHEARPAAATAGRARAAPAAQGDQKLARKRRRLRPLETAKKQWS